MASRCGESAMLANTMKSNFDGPSAKTRELGSPAAAARLLASSTADEPNNSRVRTRLVRTRIMDVRLKAVR